MTGEGRARWYWCQKCEKAVDVPPEAAAMSGGTLPPGGWHWKRIASREGAVPCGPVVVR